MSTTVDANEIRQELAWLTARVEAVESHLDRNGDSPFRPIDVGPDILGKVREITQEIFPGKCEFTHEFDPEYPEDRYLVVNVEATGEIKEIVDRECVWDERMRQFRPDLWDTVRLSVIPR